MKKALLMSAALWGFMFVFVKHAEAIDKTSYLEHNHASNFLQQSVKGIVTGPDGPLDGVTVTVVGTNRSSKTDDGGRYNIEASIGEVLRFTSVGFVQQEITVTSGNLNLNMDVDAQSLDQVVVVGYGTQRKGNLTGAVSSVNVKENLEGRPISDVGRAIQGTTPGLSVTVPSGEIGSDPKIRIRGAIASFQASSSPLILLDNVEIPSIQYVNPDDVESITVLKDAASASIYGAKAAAGVILITTKTGSTTDRINLNYSNNFSFQNPFKEFKMGQLNALKYTVDALERVGAVETGAFYKVNRESYEKAVEWEEKYGGKIGPNDPTVYGRDWYVNPGDPTKKYGIRTYNPYDYMIREWAPTQTHNASISGNAGKTKFNASFGFLDQSGMMKPGNNDEFSRYNGAVKVNTELNDFITVRGGALFSQRNKSYPYMTNSTTADPWLYLYRWSSLYPMGLDERGEILRSPHGEAEQANGALMKRNYVNLNIGGTIKLKENWTVDIDYNFTNEDYHWRRNGTRYSGADTWVAPRQRFDDNGNPVYVSSNGDVVNESDPEAILAYDLATSTYTALGANPDHIYQRKQNEFKHTINALTTYSLSFDEEHNFKFIAGLNRVTDFGDYNWTQRTELLDITNPQFDLATGLITGSGGEYWGAQLGYFGRVNYSFKDKYLFEGNIRYDGSSKFPSHLKWRWFPSLSAGWVVSEESFMEWSKDYLNQFKFRGSWGVIGNQAVPSDLYVSNMTNYQSSWVIGDAQANAVQTPGLIQSDVTWEDIETLNIGVDARFFNNKLGITADWYQRNTKNLFARFEGTTFTLGGAAPFGNFGKLKTKGWEVGVDYNHRFENGLGINLRANIDDAVTRTYGMTSSRTTGSYYDGKMYGDIWGYETDRLYQLDDFVLDGNGNPQLVDLTEDMTKWFNSGGGKAYLLKDEGNGMNPVYQPRFQNSSNFYFGPGDVKFKDLNGDGEIDNGDGTIDNPGDTKVIGNSTPRYQYGFRIAADYKGFDFAVFFQGVGKRSLWNASFLAIPGFNVSDGAMPASFVDDYWTPENTSAFYPAAFNNGGAANNNMQAQSKYLLDMSYLRAKNISFGYTFPSHLVQNYMLQNLRVYVSLENFFTWDKLRGLPIDPEEVPGESMFNTTNYNSGRIGVGVPTFKSASFGVQINF